MQQPELMPAMVLDSVHTPLRYSMVPVPLPGPQQVLVKIIACGVCRTDLHIIDGELPSPRLPLIPGHEIIGKVVSVGSEVTMQKMGDIVGIPWLANTCGSCTYCRKGMENLCDNALFTGYTVNGGYAAFTVAYAHYCNPLPAALATPSAAPLLCAGLIGFRAYSMTGPHTTTIGIYGFGAAAHILIQIAVQQGKQVYVFTRNGDTVTQIFARQMGAAWSGDALAPSPVKLDAAIIFAPAGELLPKALADTHKGGIVVCGGIHMSDIPSFPYRLLWEERVVRSVANLTRQDGEDFFEMLSHIPVHTIVETFPLQDANLALARLRNGQVRGAAVLVMDT